MARKNYLYLGLALACFLGIILIFVFDGYVGVYDSLVMDNGVFEQRVEGDQWDTEMFGYLASVSTDGSDIEFTYTVANHRFSAYEAPVAVTLWYDQDKIADLATATISTGAFASAELTWSIAAAEILPEGFPKDERYNTVMVITRGEIERRVRVYIEPSLIKEIIIPPPPG